MELGYQPRPSHSNASRCWITSNTIFADHYFLGTSRTTAWKIARTGFATVAALDEGFFGRGSYFTSDVKYAKFYSSIAARQDKPCLVLALVIPGNSYPVTEGTNFPNPSDPKEHDKEEVSLKGNPVKKGYQSHHTHVHATKNDKFGHVCNPPVGDITDELVLFQDAQALPLFVIYFKEPNHESGSFL